MYSGRQALVDMERAIADTRAGENRLDGVLASATETAERLRREQADAFRALARMRLDAIQGETIAGRLDASERRALQLMESARRALADLKEKREEAAAALAAAERDLHAATEKAETIDDEIDRLAESAEARATADPAWVAAQARVAEARRITEEAEKKAATAEEDRRTKGAPYEADPLFMYLWTRGFSTDAYRAGNVTRFFDRKVAALVGFVDARPNYAMLNEIPLRLRAHADRRKEEVTAAELDLAAVERRLLEAAGVGPLEDRRAEVHTTMEKARAAAKLARDHLAAIDAEHKLLMEGDGKGGYAQALDLIAGEIAREDLRDLLSAALATPDPSDETIVRRLQALEGEIAAADREIAEIRREARDLATRRTELETVRDDFRRHGYDQPQVTFGNERMIGEIIGGIIGGVLRSPDLWRVLQQGYGTRPRRSRPDFGGGMRFPGPGPWGNAGGGSWGGGGGSGSDSGDGGFKTGGGF